MFCSKCGKEIPNDSSFCPGCGNAVNAPAANNASVATAPDAPSAFSVACGKFLGILKGIFSINPTKVVNAQAKNTGLEWIFGLSLAVLTFVLYKVVAVAVQVSKYTSGGFFVKLFAKDLILALFVFGALVFGMWVITKLVTRKDNPWFCIFNVAGTATLPLSAAFLISTLLCVVWMPLASYITIVGQVASLFLLYAGFEKLEKPVVCPIYPFTLVAAFALLVEQIMKAILF